MSIKSDINLLKKTSLFGALSQEHLRLLAFGTEHLTLAKNQVLFNENESSDSGYVINSGKIKLVQTKNQQQKLLGVYGEGYTIGEKAIFVKTNRPASAIASTKSDVLMIRRVLIRRVLEEYPEITLILREHLLKKLVEFRSDINQIETHLNDIPQDPNVDVEKYLSSLSNNPL